MVVEVSEGFFQDVSLDGHPRIHLDKDVTIGMSAHGNHATTREALTALFLSVEGEYELILVDDCSQDATLDLFCQAADHHANTKIFSFGNNLEYSGSLNAILSHGRGTFVLFLSNDILITPSYIATLLEVARHSEEYGIVRGCSNFVDNGLDLYNVYKDRPLDTFAEIFAAAAEMRQNCRYELVTDEFLTGDAFLVSRKVLDAIGTLDPLFYGYFCDHDFGVRARRAGFSPVLARGAFAVHRHNANFEYLPEEEQKAKGNRRWSRVYENWARFKLKYGMPVELAYSGVRNIPWLQLADPTSGSLEVYQVPADYSSQCVYDPSGDEGAADHLVRRVQGFFHSARLEEGEKLCRWWLQRCAKDRQVLTLLATILTYQCRVDEAIEVFRRALAVDGDVKTYSSLLLAMNYSDSCSQEDIYRASCGWAETFCEPSQQESEFVTDHPAFRIGFVSGDFRRHSICYFLLPLLENLCKNRFKVYCYSDVMVPDSMTDEIRSRADVWHDVTLMGDRQLAELIRNDEIDILIDLAGHSGKRIRLPVFCHRPAPVQVSWLGYPNTSGLSLGQYRFTDEMADPVGSGDALHSESLVRLPSPFLCYKTPLEAPGLSNPPFVRNGFITFGSFNMISKMSPTTIVLWAKILKRVSGSRLLLKCHYFADHSTVQRVRGYFRDYGIDADRIEFKSAQAGYFEHLETYNEIDIALDTYPYNGTTTTFEALFMGVPVISLAGDRHASRVGKDILEHMGLGRLSVTSGAEYVACAADLADQKGELESLRTGLRKMLEGSPLCDSVGFTQRYQDALENLMARQASACDSTVSIGCSK